MEVNTVIPATQSSNKRNLSALPHDIPPHHVLDNVSFLWFNPVRYILTNNQIWKSRLHRKGRPLSQYPSSPTFPQLSYPSAATLHPDQSTHPHPSHLFHPWKPYNISWWTATLFTLGSLFWLINGAVAFHWSDTESLNRLLILNITAFIGGTLFYFGGWCMYWESLNAERRAHFSTSVRLVESNFITSVVDLVTCRRENLKRTEWKWIGWGERGDHKHSWRSMSFMANFSQFCGTSIFWIAVWAAWFLPADESSFQALYYGIYWTPQIIGATFLTISSVFLTLETQTALWKPNLLDLGWHVGFWNILGSLGFLVSGVFGIPFGPEEEVGREWGVDFATYLGSYFFLLGSALQYIEICRMDERQEEDEVKV